LTLLQDESQGQFRGETARQGRSVEAMSDLEDRLAELEQRLAAVEARSARAPRGLIGLWREVVPSEVRTHLRAARKERLLAARAFLDHRLEHLEKAPADTLSRRASISLD
jgi:chromatin segregation and condensation protein Rec8/ScpA/Scc1 (kleisin family)